MLHLLFCVFFDVVCDCSLLLVFFWAFFLFPVFLMFGYLRAFFKYSLNNLRLYTLDIFYNNFVSCLGGKLSFNFHLNGLHGSNIFFKSIFSAFVYVHCKFYNCLLNHIFVSYVIKFVRFYMNIKWIPCGGDVGVFFFEIVLEIDFWNIIFFWYFLLLDLLVSFLSEDYYIVCFHW